MILLEYGFILKPQIEYSATVLKTISLPNQSECLISTFLNLELSMLSLFLRQIRAIGLTTCISLAGS